MYFVILRFDLFERFWIINFWELNEGVEESRINLKISILELLRFFCF